MNIIKFAVVSIFCFSLVVACSSESKNSSHSNLSTQSLTTVQAEHPKHTAKSEAEAFSAIFATATPVKSILRAMPSYADPSDHHEILAKWPLVISLCDARVVQSGNETSYQMLIKLGVLNHSTKTMNSEAFGIWLLNATGDIASNDRNQSLKLVSNVNINPNGKTDILFKALNIPPSASQAICVPLSATYTDNAVWTPEELNDTETPSRVIDAIGQASKILTYIPRGQSKQKIPISLTKCSAQTIDEDAKTESRKQTKKVRVTISYQNIADVVTGPFDISLDQYDATNAIEGSSTVTALSTLNPGQEATITRSVSDVIPDIHTIVCYPKQGSLGSSGSWYGATIYNPFSKN